MILAVRVVFFFKYIHALNELPRSSGYFSPRAATYPLVNYSQEFVLDQDDNFQLPD